MDSKALFFIPEKGDNEIFEDLDEAREMGLYDESRDKYVAPGENDLVFVGTTNELKKAYGDKSVVDKAPEHLKKATKQMKKLADGFEWDEDSSDE